MYRQTYDMYICRCQIEVVATPSFQLQVLFLLFLCMCCYRLDRAEESENKCWYIRK